MVGKPFQFQGNGPDDAGPRVGGDARQSLDRLGEAEAVAHRGISGDAFRQDRKSLGRGRQQHGLHAPVLIAELDLQV